MVERAPRGRRGTPAGGAIEEASEEERGGGGARVMTREDDEEEEEEAEPDRPYAAPPAGTTRRCLCDLVLRLPTWPTGDSTIDTAYSVSDMEAPESSGSSTEIRDIDS